MSTMHIRTINSYQGLMNTNALAHVARLAFQTGLIASLKEGQKKIDELAGLHNLDGAILKRMVPLLKRTGLIEQYGEFLALSPAAQVLPLELSDLGDRYWNMAQERMKAKAGQTDKGVVRELATDYEREHEATAWLMTPAALMAAQLLEIGKTRKKLQVMDLACGPAVFLATMLFCDPESHGLVVDRSENFKYATETFTNIGVEKRVDYLDGELLTAELPTLAVDFAILTRKLHLFSETDLATLFFQISDSLRPGGELLIVDTFADDKVDDLSFDVFQFELAIRTGQTHIYSSVEIARLLRQTGFTDPQFGHLPCAPNLFSVVLAKKQN